MAPLPHDMVVVVGVVMVAGVVAITMAMVVAGVHARTPRVSMVMRGLIAA